MKNNVLVSYDFGENLKLYSQNKKSLPLKILELKTYLENKGFDIGLFKNYDIKNLGGGYYRIKFIPYRIIIFIRNNKTFEFVELFKRKGKSDYKKYN